MVRAELGVAPAETNLHLLLRSGRNTYRLNLDMALALAHFLPRTKRYQAALRICQKVAGLDVQDLQAVILLACCEAGLNDYEACQKTLRAVFSGDKDILAEHLQAAFVYHDLGMNLESAWKLIALTNEQPDLPMAWLILGDHLSEMGKREKASLCWRLAIDRDRWRGPAMLAATRELACAERTNYSTIKPCDTLPHKENDVPHRLARLC